MGEVRVAVLGVGAMGADHVARLATRTAGARVVVVSDLVTERAEHVAASVPGCRVVADPLDAIADPEVDAVLLATPGAAHEKQLVACLELRRPVLCEKPLTTDVASALDVVTREVALGSRLIQVGFMRRFDDEYVALESLLDSGDLGRPLLLHCVHRNATAAPGFDAAMILRDSLVHEIDVTRFLFGEEIAAVQIITPTPNPGAPIGVRDPLIALLRTESGRHVDVELFVTTGVGYEVRTEVVGERGSAMIGLDVGLVRRSTTGRWGGQIPAGFRERFARAYDTQLQRWVDAVRSGAGTDDQVDGPCAWDGYAAAAVCAAAVESLETGERVAVRLADRGMLSGAGG
ncbi:Gfo/Idh/MocA family oxidoreductase [Aldersonia sp. NBC_00410]|uniref:Gfo/Idh/MocA family protein n=1 Tax=Aldersonia sp. NBC_00410 TaxID=2975954 RepID=UPI00225AE80B|nr:Gfo/Idh/MocA family oxidoreductase [Aldersonia sp. NBC_00410]MCX5044805.1 Gfo/Idh/MocA family oxidoreductase [Aldersonia sp. NBC_00410]